MIEIGLIGRFRLAGAQGEKCAPRSQKASCILAYLALSKKPIARREVLTSLLWSESDEERGRASLRQALRELRTLSHDQPKAFILTSRNTVELDEGAYQTDLTKITQALENNDIDTFQTLMSHPEPELLAGMDAIDPLFDSWLRVERERVVSGIARSALDLLESGGLSFNQQCKLADIVLSIDPFAENAVQVQMEALEARGRTSDALSLFENYRKRLREEFEIDESAELRAYAQMIRQNSDQKSLAKAAEGFAEDEELTSFANISGSYAVEKKQVTSSSPSIAIMPLRSPSDNNGSDFMSEAFANDLVSTLSRFSEWMVVNPNLRSGPLENSKLADLQKQLHRGGIEYLLECELKTRGESKLHVNVRLYDCILEKLEFSQEYMVETYERLALLNEISCKVASSVQIAVATSRLHKIRMGSNNQRAAYDFWLEGQHLLTQWNQSTESEKIVLFEKALALDPEFASAYSGLAAVLNSQWFVLPGKPPEEKTMERAFTYARRAVELDPLDSRNHVNLGWSHLLAHRFECAELYFTNAVNLNPANPNVAIAAALAYAFCGNYLQAKALCDRAFDLNPGPPEWYFAYKATIAFLNGDFDVCVEAVTQSRNVFPDIHGWSAAANYRLGRISLALDDLEHFHASLSSEWAGERSPSKKQIRDWFVSIFPIRDLQQLQVLRTSIEALSSGEEMERLQSSAP
ncbi:MAG: BTAD domain-containing putative transcriptional regulator [Rhizobiaceae bacterium]|nr:BTAD domain-containing putative transcriptional regulator [Rhizobiaceae bacterium]